MGVDTSTQPLTIYNMVSSLLTTKIFLEGILLPTFDINLSIALTYCILSVP